MNSGSLYRRFYLYTLLLCTVTLVISFAAITLGRHGEWRETMRRLSRTVGGVATDDLAGHFTDGQAPKILADLAERFDANVTLLDAQGERVASVGADLLPPTAEQLATSRRTGFIAVPRRRTWLPAPLEGLAILGDHDTRNRWSLLPLEHGETLLGYLQLSPTRAPESQASARLALTLGAILIAIALLMIPATRNVTQPLVRLTASARRFAEGDFAHRVPVEGPREIARLGAEMNEMAQRLSTVLHTQRQLLADVSHELRSPLTRIEVALELARASGVAEAPLKSIEDDVTELRQLITDILASSRLELRPDLVRREVVSASELLIEARDKALASGLPRARLRIEDATNGATIRGDPELVSHALTNLLDNARKHTPEGTAIVIGGRREADRMLLFVQDQGPGIPADELPRLFEPFYRPDASRTRTTGGGAGLGLSLVRRIAEIHGAPPFVTSAPGQGSTFGITVELG